MTYFTPTTVSFCTISYILVDIIFLKMCCSLTYLFPHINRSPFYHSLFFSIAKKYLLYHYFLDHQSNHSNLPTPRYKNHSDCPRCLPFFNIILRWTIYSNHAHLVHRCLDLLLSLFSIPAHTCISIQTIHLHSFFSPFFQSQEANRTYAF